MQSKSRVRDCCDGLKYFGRLISEDNPTTAIDEEIGDEGRGAVRMNWPSNMQNLRAA